MITTEYIEEAIMQAAQEVIDYAKTTYDKLYTWRPVNTMLRFNGQAWEDVEAPGNNVWRWYGNPNDDAKRPFNPGHGEVWIQVTN